VLEGTERSQSSNGRVAAIVGEGAAGD